ncbi:glycosyltransferase, partial [Duganella sp. FT135W]
MNQPHICFVAPILYPVLVNDPATLVVGGAEVQQCFLARALCAAGYRVSVVTGDFGQPDEVMVDGIRVIKIRRSRFNLNLPVLRYLHPRLTSIWAALRRADADIYYQRCAAAASGVVVAFARWHGRRAVFAAASDIDLVPGPANSNKSWRDRQLFGYGLRRADAVLVQNPLQLRLLADWTGRRGTLVPSCYALPAPAPAPEVQPPPQVVLWAGMMRVAKRPELVLELAARLPQLQFRMLGGPSLSGGSDDCYAAIQERARALPNVEFVGFVPYAQADRHFDEAAVFLNTSLIEGFPNTFLQAWARAVPTVSFFDCGAADADGPIGLLAADLDAMAAQLAALAAA